MTLRNASGKFQLPFGRKSDGPTSPNQSSSSRQVSGTFPASSGVIGVTGDGDSDSHLSPGGSGFDGGGLGRKIGKSIAHTSLLPSLGNQELRSLQDIISSEKGVLVMSEKLAHETQNAASKLPVWGKEEGPDLQDILTHSSTLLSSLATALHVFVSHQASMRASYKRIREREEALDDIRRRRKNTGSRADSAEKKLAKMGPENKQLPAQNELLEKLRAEMRSLDNEIITEETKLGDFKRQAIKEALSLKFGGLEELGEKMCIIGELGKLLLEEIPLEETPVGYPRAQYTAYDRTEHTVNEATKCLATVQFNSGSTAPKPPGLPHLEPASSLRAPSLPNRHDRSIADAEEFAHYPGNIASPPAGEQIYRLDHNPYDRASPTFGYEPPRSAAQLMNATHTEFGGTHSHPPGSVVWQGPTDEALAASDELHGVTNGVDGNVQGPASTGEGLYGHGREPAQVGGGGVIEERSGPEYEYEQQTEIDAVHAKEEAAWRNEQAQSSMPAPAGDIHATVIHDPALAGSASVAPAHSTNPSVTIAPIGTGVNEEGESSVPWEPLNVKREKTPEPTLLSDKPVPTFGSTIPPPGTSPSLAVPLVYSPRLPPPTPTQIDTAQAYDAIEDHYDAIKNDHELEGAESNGYFTPREGSTPVPGATPESSAPHVPTPKMSLSSPLTPGTASAAAAVFPLPGSGSGSYTSPQGGNGDIVSSPSSIMTFGPGTGLGGVGKISAAAFRRGVKLRTSTESGEFSAGSAGRGGEISAPSSNPDGGESAPATGSNHQIRRLPVPPLHSEEGADELGAEKEGTLAVSHAGPLDVDGIEDAPPTYGEDSLR